MSGATPVLVTGMGVAAPTGLDTETFWRASLAGQNAVAEHDGFDVSRYPCRLAGRIRQFDASEHLPGRLLPQTDRMTRLALFAAERALSDAAVDTGALPEYGMGVVTSTACGGFEFTHREFAKLWAKGPHHVSVYESFAWFYAVNTGQISIRHGMRGPCAALVAEQAGGLDAIGQALRSARRGTALVTTGGVDSALDPWGWVSQVSGGRVSTSTEPEEAYLPFDERAHGYVPGEGGAILVLERADAALERGVSRVHGVVSGHASTFDPPRGSGRPRGLRRAIEAALSDAEVGAQEIGVVFADAVGVPQLDQEEAEALRGVFGPEGVPVTAPKVLTGRLSAGGPPVDVVSALLTIRDGLIPATAHTARVPAEYGIDVVRENRAVPVRHALVLARGRHGFNSALVVSAGDVRGRHG
ncbi:ketosynthase chain-length factor [Streptomyces misionensis]|uniref:Ketosynthase chain-length factor n=1 Tax=Streptomyces misionensis TaxID=67331 RepID=A0A5C6K513_9ACTN|nr:ketosynthase chain-length factor [Streptomyces misionensis]TWV57414.1 ketosynthase chain-length factor [Streptomyces misionensis]